MQLDHWLVLTDFKASQRNYLYFNKLGFVTWLIATPLFQSFIALAVKCIEVENLTDTYTLALTAYAMTLYKPTSSFTDVLLQQLMDKAIIKGKGSINIFWTLPVENDFVGICGQWQSREACIFG